MREAAYAATGWTGPRVLTVSTIEQGLSGRFESLVRAYRGFAFSVAMHYLWNRTDAEEAVQQAFVRAWQHFASFDKDAEPRPWIATIVTRVCLDRLRERKRHRREDSLEILADEGREPAGPEKLERELTDRQLMECIRRAITLLPPTQQRVFVLRDLEDLSVAEVARICSLSVASVKTNLCYARKTVRIFLRTQGEIERYEP